MSTLKHLFAVGYATYESPDSHSWTVTLSQACLIIHSPHAANIQYTLMFGLGKPFDDPLGHCGKELTIELNLMQSSSIRCKFTVTSTGNKVSSRSYCRSTVVNAMYICSTYCCSTITV